jgi:hypothetical protein
MIDIFLIDGISTGADPGFLERGMQPLKKGTDGGDAAPNRERQRREAPNSKSNLNSI